jgi:hypothetical protein
MPQREPRAPVPRYPRLVIRPADRIALVRCLTALVGCTDPDGAGWAPPPPERVDLWLALPVLAEGHGVAALVAAPLAGLPPAPAAGALADAAARTAARGRRLWDDRSAIARALEDAAIPFAWLKGAWLADHLYQPPEARPAADLDLLVPGAALARSDGALRGLGYELAERTWRHRTYLRPENRRVVDARGEHPENPRPVELHLRLVESFRGLSLDLTEGLHLAGPASQPETALGLLHLAAHATVDALSRRLRLIQLVDLARLAARSAPEDWDRVERLAGHAHGARFVWPALDWSSRWLGAPAPPRRLEALRAHCRPALQSWVDQADLDALSPFGRDVSSRPLGETLAVWPLTRAERLAVWRFILLPGRWQLAERYPRLADSAGWPLMYPRHAGYSLRRLRQRWGQRP